jgi:hypothetical protein
MARKLIAALLSVFGVSSAAAVEEPPFQLIGKWKDCEVRSYPALVAAESGMAGTRSAGEWATFRALANYIFGGNASQEKIAMTAPVLETRSGETWTMRFTMPQGRALGDLPAPTNAKVAIAVVPPTRVGVIAFSGYASDQDIESKAADLTKCLKANGFSPDGAPALAQYDPPWVLGPWRRNEVMIRVR